MLWLTKCFSGVSGIAKAVGLFVSWPFRLAGTFRVSDRVILFVKVWAGRTSWLLLVVTGAFGGLLKMSSPPEWWHGVWTIVLAWVRDNQFWLLLGPPVMAAILQWVSKRLERLLAYRQLSPLLGKLLAQLRPRVIPSPMRTDPESDHRLTLFKANRRQTKLKIVARSSEATSGSSTAWRIHPDDQNRCEGVAGVGWFTNTIVVIPAQGEPQLPQVTSDSTQEVITEYARRTFAPPRTVDRRKGSRLASSFATVPIRINGRRWGVLVLDSVHPEGARHRVFQKNSFAADMLAAIIEGWRKS